jgi:hypothetical protein
MSDEISQEQYKSAFRDVSKRKLALEHALDIRKFEIELYWKRATYFWTFIGATFAGYGAVQVASGGSESAKTDLSVILSCLGFVLSFAWFCANKGSKQWQENWENHVDMLEDGEVGPLYKIVLKRQKETGFWWLVERINGPAPYSVSKVNQIISLFVTVLWLIILCNAVPVSLRGSPDWEYVFVIAASVLACGGFYLGGRTDGDTRRTVAATRRYTKVGPYDPRANSGRGHAGVESEEDQNE